MKLKKNEKQRCEVAKLGDNNFDDNTKFFTLTFKENIIDIDFTNTEFEKFIKR